MAQYRIGTLESETAFDEPGVKTAEPSVAADSLAPHATSAVPPETPAQLPTPAIAQDSSPIPADPGRATAPGREAAMFDRAEPSPPASSEPQYAALEGTSAGKMAAEIAHLQALIDGLTQKVEWRIHERHRG